MAIRRKTSEADGMAAVREVRAFFEAQRAAAGEPAELHNRGEYLLISPEVEQAFAALPRPVRATFVRFTLEELATLAPAIVWRCAYPAGRDPVRGGSSPYARYPAVRGGGASTRVGGAGSGCLFVGAGGECRCAGCVG